MQEYQITEMHKRKLHIEIREICRNMKSAMMKTY